MFIVSVVYEWYNELLLMILNENDYIMTIDDAYGNVLFGNASG